MSLRRTTFRDAAPREAEASSIQVLERTFGILMLFGKERPEWTTTEIARAMDLKLSTTHRIVRVLRRQGYLGRDGSTKRYHLGWTAFDLGARAQPSTSLPGAASRALRWLAGTIGEAALLSAPDESRLQCVWLDCVKVGYTPHMSRLPKPVLPMHAGAAQKVLLAFLPDAQVEEVLTGVPLLQLTRNTMTQPVAVFEEIRRIRAQGYAISVEETSEGAWGVAVPLLDVANQAVAGLATSGPLATYSPKQVERHVKYCGYAATLVANTLGLHTTIALN